MSSKDKKPSGGRPTIRTLADLNRRPSADDGSDSDEPQEYYTGGEKSGMLVQDPTRRDQDNNVDELFEQARQMGAMQGPYEPTNPSSSRSFTGTSRLLSGGTVPPPAGLNQPTTDLVHNICFWTNGFTVDDGPLRRFDDPENLPFLESIKKSECPQELQPTDRRTMVHVNLMRRDQDYPEPAIRQTAFQGVGRTLGSSSASSSDSPVPAPKPASSSVGPTPIGLSVDSSLPSTTIQLRLADGTRMVAQFNTSHTVGHIRAFIDSSRPGSGRNYQLQTVGFPPKVLTDADVTIEQAGLANSVVIQKM